MTTDFASIHPQFSNKETADMNELVQAIRGQDVLSVRRILRRKPELAKRKNEFGITPLHEAAESGNAEMVEQLLANGAEIDAKDKYSHTPLFKAVWFLNMEIVQLLISRGANVHIRDCSDHTLLHWAAFKGDKTMVELLLHLGVENMTPNKEGKTPLEYAMAQGHYRSEERRVGKECRSRWSPYH